MAATETATGEVIFESAAYFWPADSRDPADTEWTGRVTSAKSAGFGVDLDCRTRTGGGPLRPGEHSPCYFVDWDSDAPMSIGELKLKLGMLQELIRSAEVAHG